MTKPCTVCGGARDNGTSQCRACRRLAAKAWRATPEGKASTKATEAARKNKVERAKQSAEWTRKNAHNPRSKEVAKKAQAKYWAAHKDRLNEAARKRLAANPLARVKANLRRRLREILRRNLLGKPSSAIQLLGCEFAVFKTHLDAQFVDGMSWENYGAWELDHIHPVATADTMEKVRALFHYTNIQPLWSIDNKRKQDKILHLPISLATDSHTSAATK